MKRVRVFSVHGAPFSRCGMEFTQDARVLQVGVDIDEQQLAWLERCDRRVLRVEPVGPAREDKKSS